MLGSDVYWYFFFNTGNTNNMLIRRDSRPCVLSFKLKIFSRTFTTATCKKGRSIFVCPEHYFIHYYIHTAKRCSNTVRLSNEEEEAENGAQDAGGMQRGSRDILSPSKLLMKYFRGNNH